MHSEPMKRALGLLLLFLVAIPLLLLLALLPAGARAGIVPLFLLISLILWLLWFITAVPKRTAPPELAGPRMLPPEEQPEVVKEIMDVRLAQDDHGVLTFRGRLREQADAAFRKLRGHQPRNTLPFLGNDELLGASITLVPRPGEEQPPAAAAPRLWLHWLLFLATLLTTTFAGAVYQGADPIANPHGLVSGLPYSVGLLLILGLHELGHYFAAKYHTINVTPPYFIPVPFALGTFGAFIQMRSPTPNRRALFDVAVAGPLAGLAVAVPALLIGLQTSEVVPAGGGVDGAAIGPSLLFMLIAKAALGSALDSGYLLRLSPLAFAGWLGLLVTALNLLPIGQLDGGHMARAMFGARTGEKISALAMWALFILALTAWPSLLFWALIVFFIAGRATPPLNDLSPISPRRRWLGYAVFAILALIILPRPM